MRNRSFVIGCGRLGASIASYSSQQGEDVVVLDANKESFGKLDDSFTGYTIVCDATDASELEEAGIKNAYEVIVTTGDDNANLFIAHICHDIYEIPNIFVRFDDPEKGLLIQGKKIKPIYPFQLSRDRFNALQLQRGEEE
ncbi:MAG: NAD-binding protein [Bacilli bacterium]|nr:NAD-binding protein [Bacilli bacterium]